MTVVLVDVPVISVQLVGSTDPQSVQVVVSGLTPGQGYTITGQAGGATWAARGGSGMAVGTQVVITDVFTPLNVPITYSATVDGVSVVADPITVPYTGRYVLQSLNGRTVVPFRWLDNGDPRDLALRTAAFEVPGRTTPVTRWDVAAGESGVLRIRTARAATTALLDHLRAGSPVMVLRTDGQLLDFPAVQYVMVTGAARQIFGYEGDRVWSLSFEVVDDPEPSTVLSLSSWADFDAYYEGRPWGGSTSTVYAWTGAAHASPSTLSVDGVVQRTNLCPNPSFEVDATGWGPATAGVTVARSTDAARVGSASLRVVTDGTSDGQAAFMPASGRAVVSAEADCTASGYVKGPAGASVIPQVYEWTADGTLVGVTAGATAVLTGGWDRISVSRTFGATGERASFAVRTVGAVAMTFYLDAVLIEESPTAGPYFDGDTPDTTTPVEGSFDEEWSGLTWEDFDRFDWSAVV